MAKTFEQLVGETRCRCRLLAAGLHDDELVAAEPGGEFGVREKSGDARRRRLQELVAGRVAVHVIDLLEAVEVDDHQRQLAVARLHGGDVVLQPVLEGGAVRQAGQRVEMRQEEDALLGGAPLAQVADREDPADRALRFGVARDDLDRDRAVVGPELRFEALRVAVAGIVEDLPDRRVDELCRHLRADQRADALVAVEDDIAVGEDAALDRGVGDVAELRLRFFARAARDHHRRNACADEQHDHGADEIAEDGRIDRLRRDRESSSTA